MHSGGLFTFLQAITALKPYEFWSLVLFLSGIAVWAFWRMVDYWHQAKLIENIPTAKVRSAPQGYTELKGRAKLMNGPVIVAPLSRTSCLWYRMTIEEKIRRSDGQGRYGYTWRRVKCETSDELFLLEDETGQCVIDPEDAEVTTYYKKSWTNFRITPPRRYTEELILHNDPLYAIGLFTTLTHVSQQQQREDVSHLLRQWKTDPAMLLHRFDTDRDGEISLQEWEQARQAAIAQIRRELTRKERMPQLNLLKASPRRGQRFILSTLPEQVLIQHVLRQALWMMGVFFLTGCIVFYLVSMRTGQGL